ncbi:MAG: hypothetical protein RJA70_2189 [Pseudomonadota bacterium]
MATLPAEIYEEAANSAKLGVWLWDIRTGLITWSDRVFELYELAPSEFDGSFEAFRDRLHPDDVDGVQKAIADAVATCAKEYYIEHRLITPSGKVKWLEARGRVLQEGGQPTTMVGTALDVTARKTSEARTASAEARLRLFSEHASDYVYDASMDGTRALPEIVAGSFERTTGLTPEQVEARGGWLQVLHPDDRERSIGLVADLAKGRSLVNEYRIIDGNGNTRWLRDRIVPVLDAEGTLRRLVGGVTDVTSERALQEQLASAQRQEALARLAGSVAHDFNNLLTVLMAEASFLRDPSTSPVERDRGWSEVDDTLERAAQLTASLLAFGRKQVGLVQVVDVAHVTRTAAGILQKAAGELVAVQVRAGANVLPAVASASDVHLCLLNLTLNARDAMPGGGLVNISAAEVDLSEATDRVSSMPPGRYVQLLVSDNGRGIDRADANKVFDPYFTTKGSAGTGLGLPTCQSIAQRYGGRLELLATSALGTTFRLLLPRSEKPVATLAQVPFKAIVGGTERLLLVEDDPAVRHATERALLDRGYAVTTCGSVEEALALGPQLQRIQGVLTDIRLPGKSGLDLAAHLRALDPALPILMMSGHVDNPEHIAALSAGRYPLLNKPFQLDTLARRMREVLDAPRAYPPN